MKNILKGGLDDVPSELLEKANKNIEKVLAAVAEAKSELEEVRRNARIAEKYWETVEAARKYFEVSSLFN
jgi:hypothetical protein